MRARSVAIASLVVAQAIACDDAKKPAVVDAAPPPPASTPSREASAPSASAAIDAGSPPACRIVSGEGVPPTADPTKFFDLPEKSTFSIRMSQTTRELRFEGPGRVKACGGEVAFVLKGGALSMPGAGEGPGSEQWLATPCAVVRWATGVHHVTVEADRCTLHVSNGTAFSFTFGDTKPKAMKAVDGGAPPAPAPLADGGTGLAHDDDGWSRIDGPRTYELTGWSGLARAEAAADVCQDALKDLRQLLLMMVTNVDGHGGEAASKAVGGRRRARASCALAYARALAIRDADAAGDAGASKALVKHVEDLIGGLFAF